MSRARRTGRLLRSERGVVLLFSLIALVVLLIGAAALIRSFNTTLFTAGNIGFKRDMQNEADRASAIALRAFNSAGGTGTSTCPARTLSTRSARANHLPACNYFASVQTAVDAQGVLSSLTAGGTCPNALTNATDPTIDPSITICYVIDRLCNAPGDEKTLGPANCALASQPPIGGDATNILNASTVGTGLQPVLPQSVLYRLNVLVTGPRGTRSFFQSTFSVTS